jgi:2-oxoglutarate ferredoxin oxidoreductase subunit beta
MEARDFEPGGIDMAWCPGCGNFGILNSVKGALADLDIRPQDLVFVSGIGQAAKLPQYLNCNYFNGLHGRSLPVATAIKAANPGLTVIAESGDGCMYGEGGNHFLHAIRRNPDLTHLVHNNMVYGLTKGQASPTSRPGFKTPIQVMGVFLEPLNPLTLALALKASFVARAYSKHVDKTREIIKRAIRHKGYALVDIFQPCVTFNKLNTYAWFDEHTYYLEDDYKPDSLEEAFKRGLEEEGKFPLGVFYEREVKETFEDLARPDGGREPLYKHTPDRGKIEELIGTMRR